MNRFTRLIAEATRDPAFVEVSFADAKAFQDALNAESDRLGKIVVENDIKVE